MAVILHYAALCLRHECDWSSEKDGVMTTTTDRQAAAGRPAAKGYASLEERVLARDQAGASEVFYGLVRERRPVSELLGELVRIHAPYTHVPYHQRLDSGAVRFVNNDHCLLSARASLRLTRMLPEPLAYLPLAQTVWYIPTGLDPWNQLLGKAPGHYARMYEIAVDQAPPPPQIHWPDQEPLYQDGDYDERLNRWLTLVQCSEVLPAYRVFLGLLQDEANRPRLLAQLAFAGLINVQDRMLYNRSYTTGHKAFRARATIELGQTLGWDKAHDIVYAGVPDMGVGPHWYSTYEMAQNVCQNAFEGRDHELLSNGAGLSTEEATATVEAILHGQEPAWIDQITRLLASGKGPWQILDVIQIASAETILWTGDPKGYSMPQHSFEYCNTLRWFYDTFDHPHKLKLLYVAAAFVNRAAHHQINTPGNGPDLGDARPPLGSDRRSAQELLRRLEESMLALDPDESVALTAAYLEGGFDRAPLVTVLATAAAKIGNDPHNQEIALCLVEDYLHSTAEARERLLLAAARHTAGHRKYGDPLEAYHRYCDAFGVEARGSTRGDGEPVEAVREEEAAR